MADVFVSAHRPMKALYLSHTGMTEPLGRSQVLPYLRGIAGSGWQIDLVSFEPPAATRVELDQLRDELAHTGISYSYVRRSPSHRLSVKMRESAMAFTRLAIKALSARPRIVHARSYLPGAVAGALAQIIPAARFVFDCRGLLGDEYVDYGHWAKTSLQYRILKRVESQLFRRADAVVVLTQRLKVWLQQEMGLTPATRPVVVVPCCVDLGRFRISPVARDEARRRLGLGGEFVLAYSGTLGSWYCEEEMARLFAAIRRRRPARFLVLTRSPSERLRAALNRMAVSEKDVHLEAVAPDAMPRVLAAADGGVSFARPAFSKMASSPVKNAEYLALGLPIVLNRGIGDSDELLQHRDAAVDAGQMTEADLERAADELLALNPAPSLRSRELAARFFSLDEGIARYRSLYERLAG